MSQLLFTNITYKLAKTFRDYNRGKTYKYNGVTSCDITLRPTDHRSTVNQNIILNNEHFIKILELRVSFDTDIRWCTHNELPQSNNSMGNYNFIFRLQAHFFILFLTAIHIRIIMYKGYPSDVVIFQSCGISCKYDLLVDFKELLTKYIEKELVECILPATIKSLNLRYG